MLTADGRQAGATAQLDLAVIGGRGVLRRRQAGAAAQLDLAVIGGRGVLRRRQVGAVAGNDTTVEANFRRGLMQTHGILQSVD